MQGYVDKDRSKVEGRSGGTSLGEREKERTQTERERAEEDREDG